MQKMIEEDRTRAGDHVAEREPNLERYVGHLALCGVRLRLEAATAKVKSHRGGARSGGKRGRQWHSAAPRGTAGTPARKPAAQHSEHRIAAREESQEES